MAKHFRWLFVGLLLVLLFAGIVAGTTHIGLWAQWSNDHYSFGGGTQPWALAFSTLVVGLYLLLMYTVPSGLGNPLPGVVRRFVAFWLDFVLAMMAVAPIFGVLPALTEWRRTGVFKWVFERPNAAPGDGLLIAAQALVISVALVFYYAFPLLRRRPSPGTCMVGYQVIAEDGTTLNVRTALLRTLLGLIALCVAYLAPFIERDSKNGKFWLDKVFGTRAVMLS
ncbi:MAG: RDD family protein [Candidatus Sulfotelmatobacter sp.]